MSFENNIKLSFKKAREDMEGLKNEVAFLAKRIAKLEEMLTKNAILGMTSRKKSNKL